LNGRAISLNAERSASHSFFATPLLVGASLAAPTARLVQFGLGCLGWGAVTITGPRQLLPSDRSFAYVEKHEDHYSVTKGYMYKNENIFEQYYYEGGEV
jgi:hypothetical protein